MKTIEQLVDTLELCDSYCPLPDGLKGVHGTPTGYTACEGCRCDEAYQQYEEECTESCVGCFTKVHPDEAEYVQKAADDEYGPLCQKCYGEGEIR